MKKARKIVSILLVAAMILTTTNAFAFSFDDYDDAAGSRFVDEAYDGVTGKLSDSVYVDNAYGSLLRFPAYKNEHKLYKDEEMTQEGINNLLPASDYITYSNAGISKYPTVNMYYASGSDLTSLAWASGNVPSRSLHRGIYYEDKGVMGYSKAFSDHNTMTIDYLSANLVGASQIYVPYYPINRGFTTSVKTIVDAETALEAGKITEDQVDEYTEVYNTIMDMIEMCTTATDIDVGEGATENVARTMAEFYPDGDGTIYMVGGGSPVGMKALGWTQEKSKVTGKGIGKQDTINPVVAYIANNPYTSVSNEEGVYSIGMYQGLAGNSKATGTWVSAAEAQSHIRSTYGDAADEANIYTNWLIDADYEKEYVAKGTYNSQLYISNDWTGLAVWSKSFEKGEKVELPVHMGVGSGVTYLIKWNDRLNPNVSVDMKGISYSVDGGEAVSIENFDEKVFEYEVTVPYNAASVEVSADYDTKLNSSVEIAGESDITSGETAIEIKAKAEDGTYGDKYKVVFKKGEFNTYVLDETNASMLSGASVASVTISKHAEAFDDVTLYNEFDFVRYITGATVSGATTLDNGTPDDKSDDITYASRSMYTVAVKDANRGVKWHINDETKDNSIEVADGTYDVWVRGTAFDSAGNDTLYVVTDEKYVGDYEIKEENYAADRHMSIPRSLGYSNFHWVKAPKTITVANGDSHSIRLLGREALNIDKVVLLPQGSDSSLLDTVDKGVLKANLIKDGKTAATIYYDAELAGQTVPATAIVTGTTVADMPALALPEKENYIGAWNPEVLAAENADYTVMYKEEILTALLSNLTYKIGDGEQTVVDGFAADNEGGAYTVIIPREYKGKEVTLTASKAADERIALSYEGNLASFVMNKASKTLSVKAELIGENNVAFNRFTVRFELAAPEVTIVPGRDTIVLDSNLWLINKPFSYVMPLYKDRTQWSGTMVGKEILNSYLLTMQNARNSASNAVYAKPADAAENEGLYSFIAPEDGVIMLVGNKTSDEYVAKGYSLANAGVVASDENGVQLTDKADYVLRNPIIRTVNTINGELVTSREYVPAGMKVSIINAHTKAYDYVPAGGGYNNEYLYSFIRQEQQGGSLVYEDGTKGNGYNKYQQAIASYETGKIDYKPAFVDTASYSNITGLFSYVYRKAFKAGDTVVVPYYDSVVTDMPLVFVKWETACSDNSATVYADDEKLVADENGAFAIQVPYETESVSVVIDPDDEHAYGYVAKKVSSFPAEVKTTVVAEDGTSKEYTVTVTKAKKQVRLSVSAAGGSVVDSEDALVAGVKTYDENSAITLVANAEDGYTFEYWYDLNSGRILSTDAKYTLTLTNDKNIHAQFSSNEIKYVVFKNANNQIVYRAAVDADSKASVPADPYYMGYDFAGWKLDGVLTELVADDVIAIEDLSANVTVYTAHYTRKTDAYRLSVTNGVALPDKSAYNYDDKITVKANAADEGKKFSHWIKDGENVVSYSADYSFFMISVDTSVEAVYVDESDEIKTEPVIVMAAPVVLEGEGRIAFFAERDLGVDRTFVETGIMVSVSTDELDFDSADAIATSTSINGKGQYTVRKANLTAGDTVYARAYMTYIEGGEVKTVFSNVVTGSYN